MEFIKELAEGVHEQNLADKASTTTSRAPDVDYMRYQEEAQLLPALNKINSQTVSCVFGPQKEEGSFRLTFAPQTEQTKRLMGQVKAYFHGIVDIQGELFIVSHC